MFKWIWNKELNCYCAEHNSTIRADKNGGVFGGGGTSISTPTPPPAPTTGEAIQEWVTAMPQVFAEQQRQAPLQAQQSVELAQQYAGQYGSAMQQAQAAMYPETAALQEQMAGQASAGMSADMPDWMKEEYRSNMAANIGSNVGSGMGADYMSTGMLQAQQGYQDYYRNLGLSLAGRQPLASPQTPQTGQYSQQFTPQSVMANAQQGYGSYAGLYGSMYGANAQAQASQNEMWGQIGGGALGGLGSWAGGLAIASDVCLKENIKDIDSALEKVEKLQGVTFDWKQAKQVDGGIIAQELEKVIPEAVTEQNGIKMIKPMMIIGYLIEAVKELSKKVK